LTDGSRSREGEGRLLDAPPTMSEHPSSERRTSDFHEGYMREPLSPGRPPVRGNDLRIAFYSSNFFNEDGVTLTCRRIMAYVKSIGGQVRIITTVPASHVPGSDRTILDSEIIPIPYMDIPLPGQGHGNKLKGQSASKLEREGYVVGKMLGQKAMKTLLEFSPTIMHITAPDGGGLAAISWAYRHNVPVLSTWHSNFHEYIKFYPFPIITAPIIHNWLYFFYMQTPFVLVPTAKLKLELGAIIGLSQKRMAVWGRGINGQVFSPEFRSEAFRQSHGVGPDDVLLCWSSRVVIEKRFDIFVEVIKRLRADGIKVHTLIAGKVNDESGARQVEQVEKELDNVSYIGWVSADELAVVYASSDVLLFPSAVETFGNVTLEAMASGMPVIVEHSTGSHLVEDDVNGYTVQRGDIDGFFQATKKLCGPSAAGLRQRLGSAGRQRALELYDNEANTKEMIGHYKAIMGRPSSTIKKLSLRWFWIDILANIVLFPLFLPVLHGI